MSAHEKLFTRIGNDDILEVEKKEIVHIYAQKICKLWDYYRKSIREIARLYIMGEITREDAVHLAETAHSRIRSIISRLLIEQYYNTGDHEMFDRALSLDENVELDQTSVLDMKEFDRADGRERTPGMVVFYNGLFIDLNDFGFKNEYRPHLKILIRDTEAVEKINRKLNRSRKLLEIDEITLGKKYYEGLCLRSHFC